MSTEKLEWVRTAMVVRASVDPIRTVEFVRVVMSQREFAAVADNQDSDVYIDVVTTIRSQMTGDVREILFISTVVGAVISLQNCRCIYTQAARQELIGTMGEVGEEVVIYIDTDHFQSMTEREGWIPADELPELVDNLIKPTPDGRFPESFKSERRALLENDPTKLQIIPYVVFVSGPKYNEELFMYYRTKKHGEQRLNKKASIGIGGHVGLSAAKSSSNPYLVQLCGELKEELGSLAVDCFNSSETAKQPIAFLRDVSDEVGRVHLGVVHVVRAVFRAPFVCEEAKGDPHWEPALKLYAESHRFENWSKLVLENLVTRNDLHTLGE